MPIEDDGEGDDSLSDDKVARHPHINGEKLRAIPTPTGRSGSIELKVKEGYAYNNIDIDDGMRSYNPTVWQKE